MGRALAVALIALLVPLGADAAPAKRGEKPPARPPRSAKAPARPAGPTLAEAKASMRALVRDTTRRRYRHHWERAIRGLEHAARGRDAPAGLLEAARARYALYRWSAIEADRDEALRLATRAGVLGSREGAGLAAAIRREAGDDRPARTRSRKAAPRPEPPRPEEEPDPALEAVVADVAGGPEAPALPLGASSGEGAARITAVKTWSSPEYTRVAIYLSHWVGWQKLELAPGADRPRRLALDFKPALLAGDDLARAVEGAQVDRVRAAQNGPDTVRVVLDLPGAHRVQAFGLDDPPRLVVDVGAHARTEPVAAAPAPPSAAAREPPRADAPADAADDVEAERARPIRRIVVDAGHGGHDPGALGPTRVREKDVTLAIARRLARKLRAQGFEVVLTRSSDRYLALEERTAIANTARGDLFVSIHANANPRRTRAGVETYVLNVADDRYARRLAARENGADLGDEEQGADVVRILTDLDAKSSAGASRRLAGLVQREVAGQLGSRDLGVKSALFYVLLGARMPAVLVETAFISNREEERRLASPRWQDGVAGSIARAVSGFAAREARIAAAGGARVAAAR
jgi:N-acetylmuramoyl-L-alanine amidase